MDQTSFTIKSPFCVSFWNGNATYEIIIKIKNKKIPEILWKIPKCYFEKKKQLVSSESYID